MKALAFSICLLFLVAGAAAPAQTPTPTPGDPALYGDYPTSYKLSVMKWLNDRLFHPEAARVEWESGPTPVDLGQGGEHLYGYLVNFRINSQNQFGSYTGWQKHGVLIRNGQVIKGLGGFGY